MGSTPIYSIPFADPTDLVRDWPALSEDVALAIEAALENIPVTQKKIEAFTGSGTWTVPAGVTYAIAHMLGGGAGSYGRSGSTTAAAGASGGASSVVFSDGTKTAAGGVANTRLGAGSVPSQLTQAGINAQANSGKQGGRPAQNNAEINNVAATGSVLSNFPLGDAVMITVGGPVVPESSVTVTVGGGGQGGGTSTSGGNGGSGYVYIEYYEEV